MHVRLVKVEIDISEFPKNEREDSGSKNSTTVYTNWIEVCSNANTITCAIILW